MLKKIDTVLNISMTLGSDLKKTEKKLKLV